MLLAERWILVALRNRRFTSLSAVREVVAVLLEKLNTRPMRKLGKNRRQLFEEVEKAALKPLGQKACRDGYGVVYRRASRLFDELAQARADGTYPHLLRRLAKAHVLILDDFGPEPLGATERKELLEVLEDRYGSGATVVTSQLDPKDWHAVIGEPTLADAILDRLVHNAHRLKLTGDSVRDPERNLTRSKKGAK